MYHSLLPRSACWYHLFGQRHTPDSPPYKIYKTTRLSPKPWFSIGSIRCFYGKVACTTSDLWRRVLECSEITLDYDHTKYIGQNTPLSYPVIINLFRFLKLLNLPNHNLSWFRAIAHSISFNDQGWCASSFPLASLAKLRAVCPTSS